MNASALRLFLFAMGAMNASLIARADAPTPTPTPSAPASSAPVAEMSGPDKLKVLLDQWTKDVQTKKDAKDFDAILPQVAEAVTLARSGAFSEGNDRNTAYTELEGVDRFLKSWQSYLIDKNSGNAQAASNDLRNLTMNNNSSFMPIPRSELLERAAKEAVQTSASLDGKIELNSLDDLPAALSQMELLQRNGGYNNAMAQVMNALQNLENAYQAYQDKNYPLVLQQTVNNFGGMINMDGPVGAGGGASSGSLRKKIAELKNTLVIEAVQAMLAMPDAPQPQKDETAADYLLRLAAVKAKAADWAGLEQVLQVYQPAAASFNQTPWLQEDLSGLHAYFVGQKLETAGQHLDAIRSYRQALATLGKFFPADPAASQLNDLQKKYPDLYQQALQRPINGNP